MAAPENKALDSEVEQDEVAIDGIEGQNPNGNNQAPLATTSQEQPKASNSQEQPKASSIQEQPKDSSSQGQASIAEKVQEPVANQEQPKVSDQKQEPVADQKQEPVASQEQPKVAEKEQTPVADQKPVVDQEKTPSSKQEQAPSTDQEKVPSNILEKALSSTQEKAPSNIQEKAPGNDQSTDLGSKQGQPSISDQELTRISQLKVDLNKFLNENRIIGAGLNKLEQITGLKREQLNYGVAGIFAILTSLYLLFGNGKAFVCNILIGALYPAVDSFRSVRNQDKARSAQLLIYWSLFGVFLLFDALLSEVPAYFLIKAIGLLALALPQIHGTEVVFGRVLKPVLARIDLLLKKSA